VALGLTMKRARTAPVYGGLLQRISSKCVFAPLHHRHRRRDPGPDRPGRRGRWTVQHLCHHHRSGERGHLGDPPGRIRVGRGWSADLRRAWPVATRGLAPTPVFVTQLFLAVISYYMFTGDQYFFGAVLLFAALIAGAAVLSPLTTAVLFPEETPPTRGKRKQ